MSKRGLKGRDRTHRQKWGDEKRRWTNSYKVRKSRGRRRKSVVYPLSPSELIVWSVLGFIVIRFLG